jgi:hypothetical protein
MPKPALTLPDPAALIVTVRRHRVIFDADLAALYGVTTKALNQAVKRNAARFPETFAFRVTAAEWEAMRSQNVTASKRNVRSCPGLSPSTARSWRPTSCKASVPSP